MAKLLGGAVPFWKGDPAPVTGVGVQGQACTHEVGASAGGSGERGRQGLIMAKVGGGTGPQGLLTEQRLWDVSGMRVTCHHHRHPGPCGQLGKQCTRLLSSPHDWCRPRPPTGSRAAGATPRVPSACSEAISRAVSTASAPRPARWCTRAGVPLTWLRAPTPTRRPVPTVCTQGSLQKPHASV